jgi:RNA polymerase sigma-70 factor (ECF subfamily)
MPITASAGLTVRGERSLVIPRSTQDAELVAACLSGDAAAERALYDTHVAALYRTAFRMCGDSDMAEDITQEAFVRAFRRLDQFRGQASLRTWLTSIVISAGSSLLRKGSWLHKKSVDLTDQIPARQVNHDSDMVARLDAAVARLTPKLQVVFIMHDLEEYTHKDISAALGIAVGTSKARLHRAHARLRVALSKYYGVSRS